jgi:hypothetical protein
MPFGTLAMNPVHHLPARRCASPAGTFFSCGSNQIAPGRGVIVVPANPEFPAPLDGDLILKTASNLPFFNAPQRSRYRFLIKLPANRQGEKPTARPAGPGI